jgi:hypothetical protein
MTREFVGQTFERFYEESGTSLIEDVTYSKCTFDCCRIGFTDTPRQRSLFRRVRLQDCKAIGCTLGPAIIEDTTIDGLKTNFVTPSFGTLFKHATFQGKIGELRLNLSYRLFPDDAAQEGFDLSLHKFYENVDWALDISEGRFTEFSSCGIPARLFRRDPETQAVVTRARALDSYWRQKVPQGDFLSSILQTHFTLFDDDDAVLVAPKGAKKKKFLQYLDGIKRLRDLGVAEVG